MKPAIVFAFGAMTAFAVLGLLHKQADRSRCRPRQINVLLFAWSALFAACSLFLRGQSLVAVPVKVWAIAIPSGVCAATAILLFQIGVRYGKIAASWLIVNLSSGIPILISILVYRETVGVKQGIALLAMFVSLVLLWLERRQSEKVAS
jgi:EamA domain-containing membrane protein RarD